MVRDARGHVIKPGAAPAPGRRLVTSIAATAAQFGLSVAEVEEYLAWGLDETVARARGVRGPEDAKYTQESFPDFVRKTPKLALG